MLSLSRVLVLVFAAFAVTVLAAPPTRTSSDSDGYQPLNPVNIVTRTVRRKADVFLTNAQRLARGLPPNRPRRYGRRAGALKPRQSSTCVRQTGYIQANVENQGTGYVSKNFNAYGEYGFTDDVAEALSVSFCAEPGSDTVDISTLNGAAYDFLGLITGVGNSGNTNELDGSSANYAYFGGVTQEPRGPAVAAANSFTDATGVSESIESNVWSIDGPNGITVSWVNTDGSAAPLSILNYQDQTGGTNFFLATANVGLTESTFGPGDATTLSFVRA